MKNYKGETKFTNRINDIVNLIFIEKEYIKKIESDNKKDTVYSRPQYPGYLAKIGGLTLYLQVLNKT
jgi:hypothetical protein